MDEWRTPQDLFRRLDAQYGPFTLDAAANATNHLCPRWYGPGSPTSEDALAVPWVGRAYCNPPYSRGHIALFLAKAHEEVGRCRTTLLLPVDTSTNWWHDLVYYRSERPYDGVRVEFLRRRVRFLLPSGQLAGHPPFPSMVVTIAA